MACKVPCYSVGILALKERQSKRIRGEVKHCVGEQLEYLGFFLGIGDVPTESIWVRIMDGLCHVDDIVVGACCRPPGRTR